MSYLVFFEDISGKDYQAKENEKLEYLSHPPVIGDCVSLGGQRLWHIVGVDIYHNGENTEDIIYLAHCTVDPKQIKSVNRANWFRVKAYQNRDPNLQLFLGEGMLVHVNKNLIGKKPETGYLLPQYNVKEHTVTSKPWGVVSVTSYLPSPEIDLTCYNVVYIGQCVYVPEALSSENTEELVTA